MNAADPLPLTPLTPEQQAEAEKVYRHLLSLRASGVRQAIVIMDGVKIGVRATGERQDVAIAINLPYNTHVTT